MSLVRDQTRRLLSCFPRVSGDEPETNGQAMLSREFSPRERG